MGEPASDNDDSARPGGPVRTCAGCRRPGSRADLQRYVLVDGVPTLDAGKRLPGRGAWLHDSDECRALADRRRALPRALRAPNAGSRSVAAQE